VCRFWLALLVAFLMSTTASAQEQRFDCVFENYHSGDRLMRRSVDGGFPLTFVREAGADRARLLGNNGEAEVTVVEGAFGVTFIERLITGAVQTTTFTVEGVAVHSRHTIIGRELVATQYYGRCDAR
jgi:hypothetical protein